MIYARCLYHIVMWADGRQQTARPLTRGRISDYISHACTLLGCQAVTASIGEGKVSLLADIGVDISPGDFIGKLKSWTTAWATDGETWQNLWRDDCQICTVSPEDNGIEGTYLDASHAAFQNGQMPRLYHHIILITSRSRLLIPLKYTDVLAEVSADAACCLSAEVTACSAMRNHMHLLCGIPSDVSISQFIGQLKALLTEHIHANPHLRRIEGWSDDSLAYTVSEGRMRQEEHDILFQKQIHSRSNHVGEMSWLYQKMCIPYFTSLH